MCSCQQHRGPDATAFKTFGDTAIGHTRLRILDLTAASDQPFQAESLPYHLAYNGEIYNHRELRTQLSSLGVRFRTTGDTEVLYYALARWGIDALPKLQGMFAFAWYDSKKHCVLLARDRLGIKPIFTYVSGKAILIASEAKAILASGFMEPSWDHSALYQVLKYNHVLDTSTSWRDIQSVLPGSWVMFDLHSRQRTEGVYWSLKFSDFTPRLFEDRVEEFDARFQDAVRSHLVADVPVSTFLSGGVDSAGIAAEASVQSRQPITAFTMALPGISYDEGPLARKVSRALGMPAIEIPIRGISWDEFAGYIRAAEMPQWWTTDLAMKLLCKGVQANNFRVVLSGEGPDEFLAGYDVYRFMKLRGLLSRVGIHSLPFSFIMDSAKPRRIGSWYPMDTSLVNAYFSAHHPRSTSALKEFYGFHPENVMMWEAMNLTGSECLHPRTKETLGELQQREREWYQTHIAPSVKKLSPLHANLYFEIATRLPNWILAMSDRMSAAHGLELRLPYLDASLVDFMLSLPESDRLHGFTEKHILRHVHRRRVPSSVAMRRKQPLYTPAFDWLGPLCNDERFAIVWSKELFEEVGFLDFSSCETIRRTLLNRGYRTELEKLTHEWMFGYAFSLHLLASQTKQAQWDGLVVI